MSCHVMLCVDDIAHVQVRLPRKGWMDGNVTGKDVVVSIRLRWLYIRKFK